jgi:hypothetical protein
LIQYPVVFNKGILALLLFSFLISLSVSRKVFAVLLLPVLAVAISVYFPQGTVLSHRLYQEARFLCSVPLMNVFSASFPFLLRIPRRGVASVPSTH